MVTGILLTDMIEQIWRGRNPYDDGDMKDAIEAMEDGATSCAVLCKLRQVRPL